MGCGAHQASSLLVAALVGVHQALSLQVASVGAHQLVGWDLNAALSQLRNAEGLCLRCATIAGAVAACSHE